LSANTIPCQMCVNAREDEGCSRCGGYRVILVQREACYKCKRLGWFVPRAQTLYAGKHDTTYDGLQIIHRENGALCVHCAEGSK
jgi:hypothetical protein